MSVILATAGQDDKIRFWEAPSGVCSRILRYADSQVNCLEITPDKQYLAAGGNPHIRLFEINNASNQSILTLEGHTGNVTSLGFQRNGRYLYSSSEDGTVKLWDLRSPTYSRSFDSKGAVNSVALHPNQAQIISGDQNGSVKLWDLGSSKCINDIIPESHSSSTSSLGRVAIQSVDVSNDTLIAANNHAEVFVWNPNDASKTENGGEPIRPKAKFRAHSYGAYLLHAKISPDGRSLVTTSSDKTARLFDTTNWQLTQTLSQHSKWVWDAVFSADSSYLVTASSDKTARLWNLRSGAPVRQYTDHEFAVTCVALNDSST
eukprot:CAMPEP_0201728294 /NCGR_PEP_ID=MMETSP0593-20130828/15435_1 /ASSEMBLY_ACC=CAM_ASM_000672 /TAXON_ID=267983 /ORGANISM="Skeletonema japonicum, Strain CCMP2506" /LENGTH=317 /DNA_ID=CAMNT_0048220349 /DNA_START=6 /DNA_END=959 /DNA_ORIENTATION=+